MQIITQKNKKEKLKQNSRHSTSGVYILNHSNLKWCQKSKLTPFFILTLDKKILIAIIYVVLKIKKRKIEKTKKEVFGEKFF